MSTDTIDHTALRRLLDVIGGDTEDLAELIGDFTDLAPQTVQLMKAALADGDLKSCGVQAHSLKSNARDLGATTLATLCAQAEHACKAGQATGLDQKNTALERAAEQAVVALKGVDLQGV